MSTKKEQPNDPDELAKMQEGEEQEESKTLDEVTGDDPDEILSPGDSIEWDHEAFPNQTFTFIVPSARDYREAIPSEKIGASQGGDIQFDPTVVDDLMMQYCKPQPNMDEMAPGQFKALETAFYNFVQSFRRSDAKGASQG
ncbi:MAG: hypothetical protein K9L56_13520 [Clostridiales bacterium]|nr:hypothetical protein [Clostridiales bacterium]